MEIELLIKSGMGLVVILAVLMFFFFYSSRKKQKVIIEKESKKEAVRTPTFEELRSVLRNQSSTSKELKNALDLIIKHYAKISKHPKKTLHSDFDPYMTIFYNICRHPNTTKDIILDFDKELSRINPEFKSDISDAVTKGVNSRGT